MKRQIGHKSRSFAPAFRGLLTVLLTVTYIVVGFAGEISCASETLASVDQIDIGACKDFSGEKTSHDRSPQAASALMASSASLLRASSVFFSSASVSSMS
jgi:hypothetical protein